MNLRSTGLLTLITASLMLGSAGCATIDDGYKKYDPSRRYLETDLYFSDPIDVPPTLSNNKLEEYYPVPNVAAKSTMDKPELTPPSNSMKSEA